MSKQGKVFLDRNFIYRTKVLGVFFLFVYRGFDFKSILKAHCGPMYIPSLRPVSYEIQCYLTSHIVLCFVYFFQTLSSPPPSYSPFDTYYDEPQQAALPARGHTDL